VMSIQSMVPRVGSLRYMAISRLHKGHEPSKNTALRGFDSFALGGLAHFMGSIYHLG